MRTTAFQLGIHESIDGLYRTFARYEVTFPLGACPCCFDEARQDQLSAKPLRELSCDDIGHYAFNVVLTVGTVSDFKHFLPRICELYTFQHHFPVDVENVFNRLPYASWREWPDEEQHCIEAFLKSLWNHVLDSPDPAPFVGSCLGSIAQTLVDLTDYLDFWSLAMDRSSHARGRMAEFLCDEFCMSQNPPLGPFWARVPENRDRMMEWMRRSETARKVERALSEGPRTTEGREHKYILADYHAWWEKDRGRS